jgi:hypothetical protein
MGKSTLKGYMIAYDNHISPYEYNRYCHPPVDFDSRVKYDWYFIKLDYQNGMDIENILLKYGMSKKHLRRMINKWKNICPGVRHGTAD